MQKKGFARKIAIRALLYMLSMSSSESDRVGVSVMQGWTLCSKPTVLKELKRLTEMGYIAKVEKKHRPNAVSFEFYVTDFGVSSYEMQASKHSYSVYKTNILGVK